MRTAVAALIARRGRLFALLAATSLSLALAACGGSSSSTTSGTPNRAIPVAVTPTQLRSIARSAGHPVYWAGPFNGTYELTTIADGRTYIRYLPPGIPVGDPSLHLTIGTYVRPSAPFESVRSAALKKHAVIKTMKDGSLAVQYRNRPSSVYLVFPGALYEVEVYDPNPATALSLATTGKVVPIH
jgi:hypothetical protein